MAKETLEKWSNFVCPLALIIATYYELQLLPTIVNVVLTINHLLPAVNA